MDESTKEIMTKLQQHPKQIEELSIEALNIMQSINDLEDNISGYETQTYAVISLAKDKETGKAVYTNDKLRQAAVQEELNNEDKYQQMLSTRARLRQDHDRIKLRIERLNKEHSSYKAIAYLLAKEVTN